MGLLLGCCLRRRGISFKILEKRKEPVTHSRSLGIHPVSLELFEELGFAGPFLDRGVRIRKGHAFGDDGKIGTISFDACPEPYTFILTLPQYQTEALLEHHLGSMAPSALQRGSEVEQIGRNDSLYEIRYKRKGKDCSLRARYLVGCDGKYSMVRNHAGFDFEGSSYPDTYAMGDFSDNTPFGSDAAIYLHSRGLVESFPLGNGLRRWVVKTDRYSPEATRSLLEEAVKRRTGFSLEGEENHMLSSFGVQKLVAKPMAAGNIALAGDSAHVVSPIGGQGMNLGWLDARDLAEVLGTCLSPDKKQDPRKLLADYSRRRTKICRKVIRRAEFNMKLGRTSPHPLFRKALVGLMLNTPLSNVMAQLFTMRKLQSWPV